MLCISAKETYLVSRIVLTGIDVPTSLVTGLSQDGLDGSNALSRVGVGA